MLGDYFVGTVPIGCPLAVYATWHILGAHRPKCAVRHRCSALSFSTVEWEMASTLRSDPARVRSDIRILLALEEDYRSYREVIAAAIRVLLPHVEVATTDLEGLEREVARLRPQLIVSSRPKTTFRSPTMAWIKVASDKPTQPSEVWLGQDRRETADPVMKTITQTVDSIEEKLASPELVEDPSRRVNDS